MDQRLKLHEELKQFCPNVYFQPPDNITMTYPAIVYERGTASTKHAGNKPYNVTDSYEITIIDRDPDSGIRTKVAFMESARHIRFFKFDGLNHDVYSLFY